MRISLNTGRQIALVYLQQSLTYHGVLAGRPTPESDMRHTGRLLREAGNLVADDARPVLLTPDSAPVENVSCIGTFQSGPLAKKGSDPYSSLVVAWFQKDFAMPISESAIAQIRALDWEALARDWNW